MGMGRRQVDRQRELWIATDALASVPQHVFYDKLNGILDDAGFDEFVEDICMPFYAETGRDSIPPGVYFRMLFVGYFEGIDSQRGIAWRCADSLSLRNFLFLDVSKDSPDHSSLTKIRQRLPTSIHEQVFAFVLDIARRKMLLGGKTVGVDATTLEANAAMKSIVRRESVSPKKTASRSTTTKTCVASTNSGKSRGRRRCPTKSGFRIPTRKAASLR